MKLNRTPLLITLLLFFLACGMQIRGTAPIVRLQSTSNSDGSLQLDFRPSLDFSASGGALTIQHSFLEDDTSLGSLGFGALDENIPDFQFYTLSNGEIFYIDGTLGEPLLYYTGPSSSLTFTMCTQVMDQLGVVSESYCQTFTLQKQSSRPPVVRSELTVQDDLSVSIDFSTSIDYSASPADLSIQHVLFEDGNELSPSLGFDDMAATITGFKTYSLGNGGTLYVSGTLGELVFYYVGGPSSVTLSLCSQVKDHVDVLSGKNCQDLSLASMNDLSALMIYSVKVVVEDLDGTAVLQNNGGDDISMSADGTYTFPTKHLPNASFNVTLASVDQDNYYQACTLSSASGSINNADATVTLNCPDPFVIGKDNYFKGLYVPSGLTKDASGNVYLANSTSRYVTKYNAANRLVLEISAARSDDTARADIQDVALDSSGNLWIADAANHKIKKFSSTGTFLSSFGSSGSGDGQFNKPVSVAIDASNQIYVVDQLNHRVQVFDSSGNFLRKFGSSGSGDGQFNTPNKLSLDGSANIYVADTGNHRIQIFDSNGVFIRKFGSLGSGNGQFNQPYSAFLAPNGNIYTAEFNGRRIQIFDSNGTYLNKFTTGTGYGNNDLQRITEIDVDSAGNLVAAEHTFTFRIHKFDLSGTHLSTIQNHGSNTGEFLLGEYIAADATQIYVADTDNDRVQVFDRDGQYLTSIGGTGSGDGQMSRPFGVFVSGTKLFVADKGNNRVQVFDTNGNFLFKFGSSGSGDGQFTYPTGIETNASGEIIVVDYTRQDVQIFNNMGTFLRKFGSAGSGDGQFNRPQDIGVFSNGNIAVTDSLNHRIQIFDTNGVFLSKFGTSGSGDGQFNQPYGIHVDNSGKIYVGEYGNDRVQVFDSTGSFLFKFGEAGSRPGSFSQPGGIFVSPEQTQILVFDFWSQYFQVFNMSGEILYH